MKSIILSLIFIFSISSIQSQNDLNPCGTVEGRSGWLINYQKNPSAYPRSETRLYVPLKIHLVGSDKGKGRISPENLLGTLCTINRDFDPADIQFYIDGDINFMDSSKYLFHSSVLDGAEMMANNNAVDAVNVYIVSNPAGNCGYNLPYGGIALGINCAEPSDHTLSHELGHNFSLPHPFLGWEGGVSYDNSVTHNYTNPAPETVTIDYTYFKDTLILDTLIIDTIFVEKVDGSNCTFAADGFCDTKPDYIGIRWDCNAMGESTVMQTDPNGEVFRSDGTLIMSYSDDDCAMRFSQEQMDAMRANIEDQRPNLLKDQSDPVLITNPLVNLISPINGQVEDYRYIDLQWESVPLATHYAVKISTNKNFTSKLYDDIVTTNSVLAEIDEAWTDRQIYWSVIPFNKYDFCNTWSSVDSFTTSEISNTLSQETDQVSFYPTIVKNHMLYTKDYNLISSVGLYSLEGKKICTYKNVDNNLNLPKTVINGMHLLRINLKSGKIKTQKIYIHQ